MSTLPLSEAEQAQILSLARPLSPHAREIFFANVAAALRAEAMIGPGTVYKIAMAAQRALFDAPLGVDES